MIERFEEGKRYRWTHSEPGLIWNGYMRSIGGRVALGHRASWIPEMRVGLMGGRVALCTNCEDPGTYTQRVAFDIVPGGPWWYSVEFNKYFEEVVEEYL